VFFFFPKHEHEIELLNEYHADDLDDDTVAA
jgi:hypothetical protein